jgi:hypothetical protein
MESESEPLTPSRPLKPAFQAAKSGREKIRVRTVLLLFVGETLLALIGLWLLFLPNQGTGEFEHLKLPFLVFW